MSDTKNAPPARPAPGVGERTYQDIATRPVQGDVVELDEQTEGMGETFTERKTLRVMGVCDELVWFKEYGKGRSTITLCQWHGRLLNGKNGSVYRASDCPPPSPAGAGAAKEQK